MPSGTFHGNFHVSGGGGSGGPALLIAAGIGTVVLAAGAARGAARTLGEFAVITAVLLAGIALGALAAFLVIRHRLARAGVAPQQQTARALPAHVYRTNPHAIPVREPRAIAPAAHAPHVVINLGDVLSGLLREQAAPVIRVISPASEEGHDA